MTENGQQQQQQAQPQAPTFTMVKCATCTKEFAAMMPQLRMINFPDVTLLAFAHQRLDKCPHCGTMYSSVLRGVDNDGRLLIDWAVVQTKESAIRPASEADMNLAIKNSKIISDLTKG